MRPTPTEALDSIPETERLAKLDTMTHNELCKTLSNLEHSGTLAMWHDHSTIQKGVMITIHTLYDPVVYLIYSIEHKSFFHRQYVYDPK